MRLRFRTYLSPSLPEALFRLIATAIGDRLGTRVELQVETRWSGPPRHLPDPFAAGDIDVAFCCAPTYLWTVQRSEPHATLVPFAPVFDDPRAARRPVYFSDLLVRREFQGGDLHALRGATWAFNDRCSLSGYYGMLKGLRAAGLGRCHFGQAVQAGSHLAAIDAVRSGRADVTAVDSNVWRWIQRQAPSAAQPLRRLSHVGPQPVQPLVMRRSMDPRVQAGIGAVLRGAWRDTTFRRALAAFGVDGFAPVRHADYAVEAGPLAACDAAAA